MPQPAVAALQARASHATVPPTDGWREAPTVRAARLRALLPLRAPLQLHLALAVLLPLLACVLVADIVVHHRYIIGTPAVQLKPFVPKELSQTSRKIIKRKEDLEAEQRQQVGDIKQRSQQRKRERRRRRSSSSTTTIAGAAVERALQEGRGGDVTGEAATRPAAAVAGRSGE